jgi:uncharacterized membrane protein YtjA (UPF0391 family)
MHCQKVGVLPYGEENAPQLQQCGAGPPWCPASSTTQRLEEVRMLGWAVTFFIVALIAGILGFTGVAVAAAGIAKILFFIFLVLFLLSLVGHLIRRV